MDELNRLAEAARLGDRTSLEQLVRASYPAIWRLCAALVDEAAADDLTQETFLRASRALPRFRGGASARTWLFAIARRACMDELRGRYRRTRRDARLRSATTTWAAGGDMCADIVAYEMLAALEPDRRAAFALTQLFSLSYEEAAAVCDCPPGTIRSRVARARQDLIKQAATDLAAPAAR